MLMSFNSSSHLWSEHKEWSSMFKFTCDTSVIFCITQSLILVFELFMFDHMFVENTASSA
jgi:hypothetical protein